MTATVHVKHFTFLSCGQGLQNTASQVETRGSNSGFFKEYSSYKSKNFSCEIKFSSLERNKISDRQFQINYSVVVRDGFTLVFLMICFWRVNSVPDPVLRGLPCRSWIKNVWWLFKFPNGCFDRRNYCTKSLYLWLRKGLGEEYGTIDNERKSYSHQKRLHSIQDHQTTSG